MDSNTLIQNFFIYYDNNDFLVTPNIPDKKLSNMCKAMSYDNHKSVIALYDSTLFGSASEGILITGDRIIYKKGSEYFNIAYIDLESSKEIKIEEKNGDSIKIIKGIDIVTDKSCYTLKGNDLKDSLYKLLSELLTQLIEKATSYEAVDLLQPIEEMPEELKMAYLKFIVNMSFYDDKSIDCKELAEIMFLADRIKIDNYNNIMDYILELDDLTIQSEDSLLEIIKQYSKPVHFEPIIFSIVKDMFSVHIGSKLLGKMYENGKASIPDNIKIEYVEKHKKLLNINDNKINTAREEVVKQYKILVEDVDNDTIKMLIKDSAIKAIAVGIPIGAVYLSGSVLGLSAAGMTSGLATLGMGGILGLSSMATGIGVVALIGVGVYHGLNLLTTDKELSKYELSRQFVIRVIQNTQKSISIMIDYINSIVVKLNTAVEHNNLQDNKIKELEKKVTMLIGSLKTMNDKQKMAQNAEIRIRCPKHLEIKRLNSAGNNKELYNFIISNYDTCIVNKNGEETKVLALKRGLSTEILEKLAQSLHEVGYFDTSNIAKEKISNLADSTISNISKFFK